MNVPELLNKNGYVYMSPLLWIWIYILSRITFDLYNFPVEILKIYIFKILEPVPKK